MSDTGASISFYEQLTKAERRIEELERALRVWPAPRHDRECRPSSAFCTEHCQQNKAAWKETRAVLEKKAGEASRGTSE